MIFFFFLLWLVRSVIFFPKSFKHHLQEFAFLDYKLVMCSQNTEILVMKQALFFSKTNIWFRILH